MQLGGERTAVRRTYVHYDNITPLSRPLKAAVHILITLPPKPLWLNASQIYNYQKIT